MIAVVDKDTCIGCGLCTSICGDIFELEDGGKAFAFNQNVESTLEDDAKEAEESCPVEAITLK